MSTPTITPDFVANMRAEFAELMARPHRFLDTLLDELQACYAAQGADQSAAPVAAPVAPVQAAPAPAGPAAGGSPFRTMTARFPGRCRGCQQPLAVGDTIRYGGKGLTYHAGACPVPVQPAPVAVQPIVQATPAAQLAPQATSPLAFAMAGAQKPRRTRQQPRQTTISQPMAVQPLTADDLF